MTLVFDLPETLKEETFLRTARHLGITSGRIFIQVDSSSPSLSVKKTAGGFLIRAPKQHMLYRGLLLLAQQFQKDTEVFELEENCLYRDLGFMADVSRNAVLTVAAAKRLIALLAMMGYSSFQLYMEDTYQIEGHPYFGYFRGAYSPAELEEIETCALSYGMTFVPCIQTLAHLHSYLRWEQKSIQAMKDIDNIILCGNEKTYDLIDDMFKALSHLQTRKINIGMDEAFQIGLGQYLTDNGFQNRSLIMCRHLERVLDIADKYGFSCSMWSDMFFQLLAPEGEETKQDQDVKAYLERLMARVTIINWDYYQTSQEAYDSGFQKHAKLGTDIAFAGGAWKWTGFTPDNDFSLYIAPMAHASCQKNQIKEVLITAWGDNGAEASTFSILPTLLVWSELAYHNTTDLAESHSCLLFGLSQTDLLVLDAANIPPSNPHHDGLRQQSGINPSRYLLYQDVLCPLLQKHYLPFEDAAYFRKKAAHLTEIKLKSQTWGYLFETQAALCSLLARKIEVTAEIHKAYQDQKRLELASGLSKLQDLQVSLAHFKKVYSHQWQKENKIFGLDTIDLRLGGLSARIERATYRVSDYLSGEIESIEELEVEILPFSDYYQTDKYPAIPANQWQLIATASTLYTT